MEIDLSSLWSWTLPIWSLILLVFFLVGVQTQEVLFPVHVGGARQQGSSVTKSRSLR
jgi:hypothetical protein